MNGVSKEIRAKFLVDDASMQAFLRAMRTANEEAKSLADSLQRINNLGGHGGGAPGITTPGAVGAGGAPPAFAQANASVGPPAGFASRLTQLAGGLAGSFRGAASGTKDAMTGIVGSVRDAVSAIDPLFRRLESLAASVGASMGRAMDTTAQAAAHVAPDAAPSAPFVTKMRQRGVARPTENVAALRAGGRAAMDGGLPVGGAGIVGAGLDRAAGVSDRTVSRLEKALDSLARAQERVAARRGTPDERSGDDDLARRQQVHYGQRLEQLQQAKATREEIREERSRFGARFPRGGGLPAEEALTAEEREAIGPGLLGGIKSAARKLLPKGMQARLAAQAGLTNEERASIGLPPLGGGAGGGGEGGGFGEKIAGMLPSGLRGLAGAAGPAALAYGLYKAWDFTSGAIAKNENVNLAQELRKEWYGIDRRAVAGQVFGGVAAAIHGGSASTALAMSMTMKDPAFQRLMSQENTSRRLQMGAEAAGKITYIDLEGKERKTPSGGTPGVIKDQAVQEVGGILSRYSNFEARVGKAIWGDRSPLERLGFHSAAVALGPSQASGSRLTNDTRRESEIKFEHEMVALPEKMAKEFAERMAKARESDPLMMGMVDRLYGGALGDLSMYRTAGIGGGPIKNKKGQIVGESGYRFREAALAAGYDPGEVAGANASLAATAGRGFIGRGLSVLGMRHGGLQGVEQLYGLGAQFGGYSGKGLPPLLQAIQQSVGGGGVDVTAGSQLAHAMTGQMTGGNWFEGVSGASAFRGLALGASTGTTGGDMRMARVMAAGQGEMGKTFGGTIDPLGGALAYRAAVTAAPDLGFYGRDALQRLGETPAQMMDILRTGEVPPELEAAGITIAHVRKFFSEQQRTQNLSRIVDRSATGPTHAAVSRFRAAGGSVAKFFDKTLADGAGAAGFDLAKYQALAGKSRSKSEEREYARMRQAANKIIKPAFDALSVVVRSSRGRGATFEGVQGDLIAQAMTETSAAADLRAGGAHDPASRASLAAKAARDQGAGVKDEEDRLLAERPLVEGLMGTVSKQGVAAEKARLKLGGTEGDPKDLLASAGALDGAFRDLGEAVKALDDKIRKTAGLAPVRGKPKD